MTPTRQQGERSRERNRKRGIDKQYIVDAVAGARLRAQEKTAAAEISSSTAKRGGPEPPAAA